MCLLLLVFIDYNVVRPAHDYRCWMVRDIENMEEKGDEVTTEASDELSLGQPLVSDQPPISTKPPEEQPLPESDGQPSPDSPIQSPNQPPLSPTMTPNQPILSPNVGISESQNQVDSPPHSPDGEDAQLNLYLSPEKTEMKDEKSPDFSCDIVGISKLKAETEIEDDIVFTSPRDAKPDIDEDGKVKMEKDVKFKTENDVKEEKSRHRKHSSGDSDSHHRKRSTSESESHHRKYSTSESDKGSRERKQSESNDSDSAKHSSKERHGSSRSHHGSSSKRNSSSSESPVKKHRHNSSSDHPRQSPLSPVSKAPSQPPPTGRKGYDVGDLIWARTAGASFHPAIVTKDPHYKFHTKIVKAEVGTTNLDPETRKPVLSPDALEPARQYHIQFLGDNKRMWQTGKLIIPYKGITHYENLAISDVKNIKLYRPKTEAMKSHWRDAVLIAKHLETLEIKERIRRCDHSRLSDIGDKALQRKMEYDAQVDKHNTVEKEKEHVKQEKIKSPKIAKIPMKSPIQQLMNRKDHLEKEKERDEEKEKRKSEHYRRKEEMDYKMHRISSAKDRDRMEKERKEKEKKERTKEKKSKEKAEKRKHEGKSSDNKQSSAASNPNETEADIASNTTTDPKHINTLHGPGEDNKVKIGNGDMNNDRNNEDQADSDNEENGKEEDKSSPNRQGNGGRGSKATSEIETDTIADGLGEGVLVWAKMRGYPYWPSVVTRDPHDGEFVKANDGFYKIQKKIHVLFLEYQNQRAWVATPSVVKYEGKEKFEEDKKKASASKKKDYICGKRYEDSFAKAVDYAEEIRGLSDEARKENVLLKYGWSNVYQSEEESDKDSPQKKRKLSEKASTSERMEENSDEEMKPDSEAESSSKVTNPARRKSKSKSVDSRRSSVEFPPASNSSSIEAENRLDPGTDSPVDKPAETVNNKVVNVEKENGTASEDAVSDAEVMPSPARRKRMSSQIAAVAMDVNKSSDSDSDDEMNYSKTMKVETTKKKMTPPAKETSTVIEETPSLAQVNDLGFPQLGDLVWGRMSGFPYWPAFITRSPQGLYRKVGKIPSKFMFHVQFFNWNDESGWCNSALEFDGLDQFKKNAAKHKKDKSMNPTKGAMTAKWTQAAEDAEQTLGLSRQERLEEFLVNYDIGGAKIMPVKKMSLPKPTTSAASTPKSAAKKVEKKTPVARKQSAKKEIPKRAPMYKALSASGGTTNSEEEPLPPGWRIEKTPLSGALIQTYVSPDNKKFSDKEAAWRHIESSKTPNRVENKTTDFEDNNLPEGWRCTRVQKQTATSATSDIFYWSPKGERFRTRKDVADHLLDEGYSQSEVKKFWQGRRPAPKSVLRSRGYDVPDAEMEFYNTNEDHDSSTSEDEDEAILRLPNGLKWRRGGIHDADLDLGKIFDPSSGGIIEMVQLPDIFLDHPTVSVTESDNEMVISDVDTGEFIAKKIIYD